MQESHVKLSVYMEGVGGGTTEKSYEQAFYLSKAGFPR